MDPLVRSIRVLACSFACVAGMTLTGTPRASPTMNLTSGCVTKFEPGADYFPHKVRIEDARNLRVEYFKSYKVVTVSDGRTRAARERYVLVQCGTPQPPTERADQFVTVPIATLFAASPTQLSALVDLGRLDALTGVPRLSDLAGEAIERRLATGRVREFSTRSVLDLELVVRERPSVFMASIGAASDAVLRNAGVPVVTNTEWLEPAALGRAEWIKFIAIFLNEEKSAQGLYESMRARYRALSARARATMPQPLVMTGRGTNGRFTIAGGRSYVAALIGDAGGRYVWADNASAGTATVDLEAQIARAADADIWINGGGWSSLADVVQQEPRYAAFKALRTGQVWVYDRRSKGPRPSDYWTRSATHPDLLLADLMKIFHPALMTSHRFEWYQRVPQ
jgi:iron complex transport system substrate-binding protein